MRILYKLRLEEAIAISFLIPSAIVTVVAYLHFAADGAVPRYIVGGLWRLVGAAAFVIVIYVSAKLQHKSKFFRFLREVMPFALAIAVYTNLHDTIAFVNPGDISSWLISADNTIFGVQPVLWMEQFYSPLLTEIFSFCYLNFFWYSFSLGLILYFSSGIEQFRETMLGIVLLFYAGYVFYIIFPALPPRIALLPHFTKNFDGSLINNAMNKVVNLSLASSRAAFPSLHCANTLMNLLYAYKYKRWFFFAFLPLAIGLVIGTVYLRHHYVVDILAGFALTVPVYFMAPKLDKSWKRQGMHK